MKLKSIYTVVLQECFLAELTELDVESSNFGADLRALVSKYWPGGITSAELTREIEKHLPDGYTVPTYLDFYSDGGVKQQIGADVSDETEISATDEEMAIHLLSVTYPDKKLIRLTKTSDVESKIRTGGLSKVTHKWVLMYRYDKLKDVVYWYLLKNQNRPNIKTAYMYVDGKGKKQLGMK